MDTITAGIILSMSIKDLPSLPDFCEGGFPGNLSGKVLTNRRH